MLMIRLFRIGRKNQPAYKVVVTEKKNAPARGRFVEEVGFYNPLTKEKKLNAERIKYWISVGAQASDTIHNMLVKEKIIEGDVIPKHKKAKKKEGEEEVKTAPVEVKEEGNEKKTEEAPVVEGTKEESVQTQEEKSAEPEPKEESTPEPEVKEETSNGEKEESKNPEEPKKEKTE